MLPNWATAGELATFESGDLKVDLAARKVFVKGAEVHLTPIEYKLLTTLVQHSGKVLTHRQLLKEVWGPDQVQETHYLRVFMAGPAPQDRRRSRSAALFADRARRGIPLCVRLNDLQRIHDRSQNRLRLNHTKLEYNGSIVYIPFDTIPEYTPSTRYIFFPVIVLTGFWMWKGHVVRRLISKRSPGASNV